ncbi:uncharacterized protein LOC122208795 [Panthera leo]|uniref:uncharacterized protein LOC122208795 n=1 Tax=Panthera leo TaxID=9689 RepID=UPI001C69BEA3|nr:uncharacterized protein LOC122208795 [Panthera leo]
MVHAINSPQRSDCDPFAQAPSLPPRLVSTQHRYPYYPKHLNVARDSKTNKKSSVLASALRQSQLQPCSCSGWEEGQGCLCHRAAVTELHRWGGLHLAVWRLESKNKALADLLSSTDARPVWLAKEGLSEGSNLQLPQEGCQGNINAINTHGSEWRAQRDVCIVLSLKIIWYVAARKMEPGAHGRPPGGILDCSVICTNELCFIAEAGF